MPQSQDPTVKAAKLRLHELERQLATRVQPSKTAHVAAANRHAVSKGLAPSQEGRFTPLPDTPPGSPRLDFAAEREAAAEQLVTLSKAHALSLKDGERQQLVDELATNAAKIDALTALVTKAAGGKAPAKGRRLKNLSVDRVDMVEKPANVGSTVQLVKTNEAELLREGAQALADAHRGRVTTKDRGAANSYEAATVATIWKALRDDYSWSDGDVRRANTMSLIALGTFPPDEKLAEAPGSEVSVEDVRTAATKGWVV
jgi:hypothetical protein